MSLKLLRYAEGMVQTLHYRLFLFGECKWIGRINGRKVGVS